MNGLILSLFPGIGLLDMAFEAEGFCVVRGPDLLWGGDIRRFRPPAGRFDGVIGGPPCQRFSRLANVVRAVHGEGSLAPNLIPEFERVVSATRPEWFLMENVLAAPAPIVSGYFVASLVMSNRDCGGVQNRERRISFGSPRFPTFDPDWWCPPVEAAWEPAVCSSAGGRRASVSVSVGGSGKRKQACLLRNRTVAEEIALQGLPDGFLDDAPFTVEGKRHAIGNGVPLPMGLAIARAVLRALGKRAV